MEKTKKIITSSLINAYEHTKATILQTAPSERFLFC